MIEDPEALENINEIAAVGLDGLWVGTGDLALGYVSARIAIIPKSKLPPSEFSPPANGTTSLVLSARSIEEGRRAAQQGYRLIGFGGAEQYVMSESRKFLEGAASAPSS